MQTFGKGEMFTRIGTKGVHSSDGFEIENVDRFTVAYREGAKVVTVRVEDCFTGKWPGVSIALNAFAHWDHVPTANSPKQQAQMRKNFVAAMLFQGTYVEV